MKQLEVVGYVRKKKGKNNAKKLRKNKMIPAIVYGGKLRMLKLPESEVEHLYNYRDEAFIARINLKDENITLPVVVKEFQIHPVTNKVIHIDFVELVKGKKLTLNVPIHLTGTSVGVKKGGILEHHIWELEIECDPDHIPEHIEVDITNLDIHDTLYAGDIKSPEGVKILTHPEEPVLTVVPPAKFEEEVTEEAVEEEAAPAEGTKEEKTEEKKQE